MGGKSRACLQVNLLVSRHHAVCNGMIDNRTCPSSTGNLLTSVEKGLDTWPPKQSLLGRRCVGYNFLGGEITTLAETKKGRVKNVLRESGMLKREVGVEGLSGLMFLKGSINEQDCQYSGSIV